MKNAIFLVTAWAMVLPTGGAFADDPYGGNLSTQRKATGFFRVDKSDGRHFLITPDGHLFRALGLNHFHMMKSRDYDRALQNLRDWGFNSGGYQAPPWQRNRIPHTRGIHLVPNSSWRPAGQFAFRDVFDSKFLSELEQNIRRVVEPSSEDPFLVGYFWTDIPIWNRKRDGRTAKGDPLSGQDWISFHKSLPEDAAGRKAWEDWRSENPDAAEKAFLAVIARQLYSNAHAMTRKYDTNHLILGERYLESDMPDHVVREALPYIDAIAIQPTKRTFEAESFARIARRYGKPIYISDHVSSFRTTEHPNTMGQVAADPESYVEYYTEYVTSALSHPSVIGYNKCQYQDQLLSPDFLKQGMLRVDGTPRSSVDGIRSANRQALDAAYSFQRQGDERMNVLFLCVDDLNTWLLSDPNRYTGKVVAPSIRKLASEGVVFTRAYCANPKCSPSRTAVLSGVAPWKSGIYQNSQVISGSPALKTAVSLPRHFKDNGYYTASAGKVSHGYDTRAAWDEHIPHRRDPSPPGAPLSKIGRGEKDWGPTHLPESEMGDTKYANFAIAQLRKKHDKPFLIACGLFHPHYPWYVPRKYLDLYPLDEIVLPELKADDLADVPEEGINLANPSTHERIVEANEYKNAIQGYLASTSYADAQIGRVLAALEASPYKDNTLVVLWSDHGFHLGEKSHWAKSTLWEEATHANLMFKVPGVTKPKQVCNRFVSLLDIYPTLVELCDLPAVSHLDGNSLVPLLENPALPWDKPAIIGFLDMWKLDVHLGVRTEDYRYIRYGQGGEEFYHCRKDPHEWTNQIGNPEFGAELKRHIAMLPNPAEPIPYKNREEKRTRVDRQMPTATEE